MYVRSFDYPAVPPQVLNEHLISDIIVLVSVRTDALFHCCTHYTQAEMELHFEREEDLVANLLAYGDTELRMYYTDLYYAEVESGKI